MLTIKESTAILKSHGIAVFNRYGKRYSLRREHPGYGTPESRSPLCEWFQITDCSLGDVRAMAAAYEALNWPETRQDAWIVRIGLRAAWAAYTGHRIDAERLGRAKNDWALPDDPEEAVAQIQAKGSERAHWHIQRVWRQNLADRLRYCADHLSVTANPAESLISCNHG